jgi:glycerophosphoryl diester phosphodiesterase
MKILVLCAAVMGLTMFNINAQNIMVVGHRGACGYEQENSLKSFQKAIALGVDMVELDVHLCASGELVAMHDETVERTTNGHGYVAHKTLSELQQLRIPDGQSIPTLAQVFDCVSRRVRINIELKGPHTAQPVADLIHKYVEKYQWRYTDFFVSSFDHHELLFFKLQCPMVETGALLTGIPLLLSDFARNVMAHAIILNKSYINKAFVDDIHAHGQQVYVFTVNEMPDIKRMMALGVDGIISDYPDHVHAVLREAQGGY